VFVDVYNSTEGNVSDPIVEVLVFEDLVEGSENNSDGGEGLGIDAGT
jgi:hypothetical protein